MSNNSNSFSSSSNSGCFGKFIALMTALGGGAGIVALLTLFINQPSPSPPDSFSSRWRHPTVKTTRPLNTVPSNVNIHWGNLSEYFNTIGKITFDKGFQKADSKLSFVFEARGNFSGKLIVFFYDSDGVKICPSDLSIYFSCSSIGYQGFVNFSTKNNNSSFASWQKNERDRVTIYVPNNASMVEFSFNQY